MRTVNNLLIISCLGVLSACSLLVEVKDRPANNVNNVNNANNTNNAVCGDGVVTGGESCDEENLNGLTCLDLDFAGGWLQCTADCSFDTSECSDAPVCGDGLRSETELCDGEDLGGQTCESLGRGFIEGQLYCKEDCADFDTTQCVGGGEICDNLMDDDGDGDTDCADADCASLPICTGGSCGNGLIEGEEECDGDNLNNLLCEDFGFTPGGALDCDGPSCKFIFSGCTYTSGMSPPNVIVAGESHTCAGSSEGVYCWGYNDHGQLGTNTSFMYRPTPGQKIDFNGIELGTSALAAGGAHTCMVSDNAGMYGHLVCWGANSHGQLGTGSAGNDSAPVNVGGTNTYSDVVAGREHTCALRTDGKVFCWGSNLRGQLGLPGAGTLVPSPTEVTSIYNVTSLSAGYHHTCAIQEETAGQGELFCWGDNTEGQIGNADWTDVIEQPTAITDLTFVQKVACGERHTCAIAEGSSVWCWGANTESQLGMGGSGSNFPQQVGDLQAFQIWAGANHTCVITDAIGSVSCWGRNVHGQIGVDHTQPVGSPVPLTIGDFMMLGGGGDHTCGIINVGGTFKAYCWGANWFGQLGQGNTATNPSPWPVLGQ